MLSSIKKSESQGWGSLKNFSYKNKTNSSPMSERNRQAELESLSPLSIFFFKFLQALGYCEMILKQAREKYNYFR